MPAPTARYSQAALFRLRQFLIHFHQGGDAGGFGGGFDVEAVGLHHGSVVGLVGLAHDIIKSMFCVVLLEIKSSDICR